MKESLTLYSIKTELLELMDLRDEIAADHGDCGPVNGQIEMYLRKEIHKVDSIAFMLSEFNRRADVAMEEANRQEQRSKMWESRHVSLKAYVERIMQESGTKKLEGEFNTLSLKKCPVSVEIRQPELVPHEYQQVTIKCSAAVWVNLMSSLLSRQPRTDWEDQELRKELEKLTVSEPVPMKSWIRPELETLGAVPGCELVRDKVSLQVK